MTSRLVPRIRLAVVNVACQSVTPRRLGSSSGWPVTKAGERGEPLELARTTCVRLRLYDPVPAVRDRRR
ncbi:unnamed protein product [Protopolystoma xenopodis]|uniref:Uncharacterized protein n=1 Tax=Protopolystoma xenopodis TaxID=117903 RepID=A0A3S5CEF0_9PLAT|nr:unnamed protein product [Protopolystoma xenopodis]